MEARTDEQPGGTVRITVEGAVSARFARGLGCRLVAAPRAGRSVLQPDEAGHGAAGAVLCRLENLGVAVVAVEPLAADRAPDDPMEELRP